MTKTIEKVETVVVPEVTKVERLKAIKDEMQKLSTEKEEIENELVDLVIYKNGDGTWTRFTKIDNIEELKKGTFFRSTAVNRYTTKIENLKNEPKEIKNTSK